MGILYHRIRFSNKQKMVYKEERFDPFMTLGFLALPVIPALKITDKGLVDVEKFEIMSLFED